MMNRREFCMAAGAAALAATDLPASSARAATFPAEGDPNPAGGYTLKPPRQFLFTDYRHINPGDLSWRSPDGKNLPVAGPPGPPVEARADAESVARGIRLVAQKATKEGPIVGLPNHILHDEGRYRAWSMRVDYGSGENLGSYSRAPAKSISRTALPSLLTTKRSMSSSGLQG